MDCSLVTARHVVGGYAARPLLSKPARRLARLLSVSMRIDRSHRDPLTRRRNPLSAALRIHGAIHRERRRRFSDRTRARVRSPSPKVPRSISDLSQRCARAPSRMRASRPRTSRSACNFARYFSYPRSYSEQSRSLFRLNKWKRRSLEPRRSRSRKSPSAIRIVEAVRGKPVTFSAER